MQRGRQAALIRAGIRLTFTAYYEPERGPLTWFVQVPEIYAATKAQTFDEVEGAVRELVALTLDVDADAFDVTLQRAAG